jgi:hypothetical protein
LPAQQEVDLIATLRANLPDQLGLPGQLWTRQGMAVMIQRSYGIQLSTQSVGRYLRSWGLGPRKPIERACALCAAAVAHWLDGTFPAILKVAQTSGAHVFWIGRNRLYGVEPGADMVSAVSNRGNLRFMICAGRLDPRPPIGFLDRLVQHDRRAIHAVVDGSWATAGWPRRLPDQVTLHALPTCVRRVG